MSLTGTIEAVWRIEQPKLAARLVRYLRDVGLAEEIAQDAFVAALENWPRQGIPDNPGAWLMQVAKNRALNRLRRTTMIESKHRQMATELEGSSWAAAEADAPSEEDGNDRLRLIFAACHPVLVPEQRVALALRVVGGLTTAEIARGLLVSEANIAQRIVRAKRRLREMRAAFEIPPADERHARLDAVLEVIYLIFNEGYVAASGPSWLRPNLCAEALRFGRSLAALMPDQAEVLGLLALMELQASRFPARVNASGVPILLLNQDRSKWDWSLIRIGLGRISEALLLELAPRKYVLQAMIAASHARAVDAADTDWIAIAAYYHALALVAPSPIVELNRAVAVGMAFGPAQGLAIVNEVKDDPHLRGSHMLPAVLGHLLLRSGRRSEAAAEFRRAASLTLNAQERSALLAICEDGSPVGYSEQTPRDGGSLRIADPPVNDHPSDPGLLLDGSAGHANS